MHRKKLCLEMSYTWEELCNEKGYTWEALHLGKLRNFVGIHGKLTGYCRKNVKCQHFLRITDFSYDF